MRLLNNDIKYDIIYIGNSGRKISRNLHELSTAACSASGFKVTPEGIQGALPESDRTLLK